MLLIVAALASFGCSDAKDRARDVPDVPGAYVVVLRWFVEHDDEAQEHPVVFLEPLGEGLGIGLDTQAAVVSGAEPFADVRFIDDRSEALDDDGVREDGLFIALGPAVPSGARLTIDCDQVLNEDVVLSWAFELHRVDDEWSLAREPRQI